MTRMGAENGPPPPEDPRDATAAHGETVGDVDSAEPARWERAAALFVRWRDGDSRAMDELVRLMSPPLWHVVRSYGLDHALAQDVVQTTWLTLVRRHETINDPLAVSGWLSMCARREAWRVGKQHRRADATEAESLEPHLPVHESAEQTAAHHDENRRLWSAVATLNDRCQRLLRIVAFEDRPDYARIAEDLAMPIGSIGPTRQRCLAKLRAALGGAGKREDDDGI
ncbi:sigma-70 family RNA polymerase sigma factor [Microbacterium sp. M3]|uniref:Sigma-70 family RNA polymerase sigma factor n=1 Tax=Microbacterium arthrosphaerae TaxID=792652 RepID=A0ABU4H3C8_9MICO|nr:MULTISPECIES: sigma-70 family RNA polymerase sigma factor [Microbacterium]MDW4573780.1 sigma-70 family RNA polymerase sigma factor [Microbacterium arthrosphaerae]MDW7607635.1 sigma-70 family RNA polymerase sigma factor [Microbacterium sp. M3]